MLDCRHTIRLSKVTMAPAKAETRIPMCQEKHFYCRIKLVATAESQV